MEAWLWAVIALLFIVNITLALKLFLWHRAAHSLAENLEELLREDTNTLLSLSSRDRELRTLARALNDGLRQLRAQRRRYQQGDRQLKQSVTNIAHDLRTPLTALGAYLDLLEKEELSHQARQYLHIIRERWEALGSLSEELFRYSLLSSPDKELHPEPLSLSAALEESLAAHYGALVTRGIQPQISLPEEGVVRRLDKDALGRIFSNLLHNALKYSDGDLQVSLSTTGEITFSNRAPDMDELALGRLFERFYTVESARPATGLGLSIAREFTERMGGQISADYKEEVLSIRLFFPE